MIDINPDDILLERRSSAGRFVLFTTTDRLMTCQLPFWGVMLDIGGDGHGILVRLDETDAFEGWTALDLLLVALARAQVEQRRWPNRTVVDQVQQLNQAIRAERRRLGEAAAGRGPSFRSGSAPSSYPWTVAEKSDRTLPLCSDPQGLEEGIAPEQLLIVIDQMLTDATTIDANDACLRACQRHVANALAAEVRRLADLRRRRR